MVGTDHCRGSFTTLPHLYSVGYTISSKVVQPVVRDRKRARVFREPAPVMQESRNRVFLVAEGHRVGGWC